MRGTFLLYFLLAATLGAVSLWALSYLHPMTFDSSTSRSHIQYASREGTLEITWFSTLAEDEAYHQYKFYYAVPIVTLAIPTVLLLARGLRARRRASTGFPVDA
jgi:hypothetical protein